MRGLQGHMRAEAAKPDPDSNVLRFGRSAALDANSNGLEAIDLVHQAANVIRTREARAAEVEARARHLTKRAIEQLDLAEKQVESAEIARRAAEAGFNAANARVHELEKELQRTQLRINAAEAQVAASEDRTAGAMTRALEAERALARLGHSIRTQLLDQRKPNWAPRGERRRS
jgi:chromosome segregation ATPase